MKGFLYLFVWLFNTYGKRERVERITTSLLAQTVLIQLNILSVYFYYSFDNIIEGHADVIEKYHVGTLFFVVLAFNYLVFIRNNRYLDYYENIFKKEDRKQRRLKSGLIMAYIVISVLTCIGLALYGASLR